MNTASVQLQPCHRHRVAPRAGVLGARLPWELLDQGLVSVFQSHFVASLNPISRLTLIVMNTQFQSLHGCNILGKLSNWLLRPN